MEFCIRSRSAELDSFELREQRLLVRFLLGIFRYVIALPIGWTYFTCWRHMDSPAS